MSNNKQILNNKLNRKNIKPTSQPPLVNGGQSKEDHAFYCLRVAYDKSAIYSKLDSKQQQKLRKEWMRIYNESSEKINGTKVIDLEDGRRYKEALLKDNKVYGSQDSGIESDISADSNLSFSSKDNVDVTEVKQRLAPQPPLVNGGQSEEEHIFYCLKATYDKNSIYGKLDSNQQQKLRKEWMRIYNESSEKINGVTVIDIGEKSAKYEQVLNNILIYDSLNSTQHKELKKEWSKIYNESLCKAMKLRVMDLEDKIKIPQYRETLEEALVKYLINKIYIEDSDTKQGNPVDNQYKQVIISKLSSFKKMLLEMKESCYKQNSFKHNNSNTDDCNTFSGYNNIYDLLDLEERRNFKLGLSEIYNASLLKLKNSKIVDLIDTSAPYKCERNLKKALTGYMNNKLFLAFLELDKKDGSIKKLHTESLLKETKKKVRFIIPKSDFQVNVPSPSKNNNSKPCVEIIDYNSSLPCIRSVKDFVKELEGKKNNGSATPSSLGEVTIKSRSRGI